MRYITHAATARYVGVSLCVVLTLVECTSPGADGGGGGEQQELKPRREGKISDLSRELISHAESVTSLRAQQERIKLLHGPTVTTQDPSQLAARAPGKSPALRRLIARSQARKVDTISGEQESRARSISSEGENHPQASGNTREEAALPLSARQAKYVIHGRARSLREFLTTRNIFWFGSNVLATLIPLASLLPGFASANTSTKSSVSNVDDHQGKANQTAAAAATTSKKTGSLLSPQNLIVSLASNAGGLQSRVEHVMGWLERSIEHLPNFPRLHPQECVKRCICEAHADPAKYGALGLTLRLLFPATQLSVTEGQDNMEYKVINKYRHAAGYGMARRVMDTSSLTTAGDGNNSTGGGWTSGEHNNLAATAACKEKYEDCLVSLLDVAQNLVDFFLNKSS